VSQIIEYMNEDRCGSVTSYMILAKAKLGKIID
jgi:hypothetical protein